MENLKPHTPISFASAERKSKAQVMTQAKALMEILKDDFILDMLPELVLILNSDRQAIFANKASRDFLKVKDKSSILGLRPGELFNCIHAENNSGGCGTTEFCKVCGAVKSILKTQKDKISSQGECEITTETGKTYNLRVWTFTFKEYILFIARNIAEEVYRDALEHIFFHDLTNIVSALYGWLKMVSGKPDTFLKYEKLLISMTEEIQEEINAQRDLLMAEQGSLTINWEFASNSIEIVKFVAGALSKHQSAESKEILISEDSEAVNFVTDTQLLKRIIINIAKNSLEASDAGENILLRTIPKKDMVVFEVHNKGFIEQEVQLQIFNRSFSTKAHGRGLGAYSAKFFLENYLQSKIYFTSTPENGTSFFIECPVKPKTEKLQ